MIRVLLAGEEHLTRDALAALLAAENDLRVVAEVSTETEAIAAAVERRPDVAALDLQVSGDGGIAAAKTIIGKLPGCRVLMISSRSCPVLVKHALESGVKGFVSKTLCAKDLIRIIRVIHRGNRYVDPALAADAINPSNTSLTYREMELLSLAADAAPIAEIAKRACLAPGTVRNYLSLIMGKLGAKNRHVAVHIARTRGWI